MAIELATKPIEERTQSELRDTAKVLGLKLAPNLSKDKIIHAIQVERTRRLLVAEEEARIKVKADKMVKSGLKPGQKAKPSFETIAIEGGVFMGQEYPPSKKLLVKFVNRENPATDDHPAGHLEFAKGEKYQFHLFEEVKGRPAIFVLPECLISEDTRYEHISLVQKAVRPIYAKVKDEETGMKVDRKVSERKRFEFYVIGDAPKDAPFGFFKLEEGETL